MKTVSKKVLMCGAFSLSMLGGVPYVQADAPDVFSGSARS